MAIVVFVVLLAWRFDPVADELPQQDGAIVTSYPLGKLRNGSGQVLVRFPSGQTVLAEIPATYDYPYKDGTPVVVTPFSTLLFHKKEYSARLIKR